MTATCPTHAAAKTMEAELRHALHIGKEVDSRRSHARTWTLQEALDKTLSMPKPEGWRGASYEKIATLHIEGALLFMGRAITLGEIDRDLIDAWCRACEAKGNSDATINRKISALSKMMKVAVEYGGLDAMPKMPRLRKERVSRIRFLTHDEEFQVLELLRVTGRTDMEAFVTVLIDTGMRRGELLNVRPQDVDLETGVIMVYGTEGKGTKNGRIRSVPMTARVKAIMAERLCNRVTCFELKASDVRHAWDWVRQKMGLAGDRDFVLHACRHTCASRLVRAGVSLPVVKEWLGHSSITTTMRYAHLFPQDLMNAARALDPGE
ncbi:MAG: tyrosine-type recombinase/integrase [Roseicyclus sp.]|uniref:tyrosine-type recombinase/integrase n=1 Tax=Roseicyclus sp. TaxID=1914329 RepID=UPI003A85B8E7